jgi:hypothetical protein
VEKEIVFIFIIEVHITIVLEVDAVTMQRKIAVFLGVPPSSLVERFLQNVTYISDYTVSHHSRACTDSYGNLNLNAYECGYCVNLKLYTSDIQITSKSNFILF